MKWSWLLLLAACGEPAGGTAHAQVQWPAPEPCPPQAQWPEGMACVLGGVFTLGDDHGRPDERGSGQVFVGTYYMDVHEATNADYERCIDAGRCARPVRFRGFMAPNQPMVAVSWFDAVRACELEGKRLPTEAEWERAASGTADTVFPWGNEPATCERANIDAPGRGRGCGRNRTAPVGGFPAGHFGISDMAGNVHEWVSDWYSPCLSGCTNECGAACLGVDPQGPCHGSSPCPGHTQRSVRGGSWYWPASHARASARRGSGAQNRGPHRFGFRCARDLP